MNLHAKSDQFSKTIENSNQEGGLHTKKKTGSFEVALTFLGV